jgi:hypothetical protein
MAMEDPLHEYRPSVHGVERDERMHDIGAEVLAEFVTPSPGVRKRAQDLTSRLEGFEKAVDAGGMAIRVPVDDTVEVRFT